MNTKLQELTDKIYKEGVEKGEIEARNKVENAKSEAKEILLKATQEAAEIILRAETKASEISENAKAELRLYAQQSVNALKTEIANLLTGTIVTSSVKAATTDKEFMQRMILTLVQEWSKKESLTIETKDAKLLTDYFINNAKELLDKQIKIVNVNGIKADFTVESSKSGYKISFGDEQFLAYFKEFLRPKLIEMLF